LSERPAGVSWRLVAIGATLQLLIGVVLLKLPGLEPLFIGLNELVLALQRATESGGQFVFGYLAGGSLPFEEREPGSSFILAFRALPVILVVSAVSAALTYLGVLPWVVRLFAMCLQRTLHVGGAVGLATAANIFVGMVEAPLLVRPYLSRLTRSELFVVMTVGMATIAGTVLVLYASILGSVLEDALRHLLVASVISAPAAVTVAKLMIPETHQPTPGVLDGSSSADGLVDAIIIGTQNGLKLLLNVAALLLVLVALVHLVNALLGWLPPVAGESVTLQRITGYLLAPVA
jgi:CNT family concentrative nucleoside transporter